MEDKATNIDNEEFDRVRIETNLAKLKKRMHAITKVSEALDTSTQPYPLLVAARAQILAEEIRNPGLAAVAGKLSQLATATSEYDDKYSRVIAAAKDIENRMIVAKFDFENKDIKISDEYDGWDYSLKKLPDQSYQLVALAYRVDSFNDVPIGNACTQKIESYIRTIEPLDTYRRTETKYAPPNEIREGIVKKYYRQDGSLAYTDESFIHLGMGGEGREINYFIPETNKAIDIWRDVEAIVKTTEQNMSSDSIV